MIFVTIRLNRNATVTNSAGVQVQTAALHPLPISILDVKLRTRLLSVVPAVELIPIVISERRVLPCVSVVSAITDQVRAFWYGAVFLIFTVARQPRKDIVDDDLLTGISIYKRERSRTPIEVDVYVKAKWIDAFERIIPHVPVKVYAARIANGIARQEAARGRITLLMLIVPVA